MFLQERLLEVALPHSGKLPIATILEYKTKTILKVAEEEHQAPSLRPRMASTTCSNSSGWLVASCCTVSGGNEGSGGLGFDLQIVKDEGESK